MIKYLASQVLLLCVTPAFFAYRAYGDAPNVAPPGGAMGAAPVGVPSQPGFAGMILPFALMFGVVYFLMIRPQQKKVK